MRCHHIRGEDRAYVSFSGKRRYLGVFGSDEAKLRYDDLIAAWLKNGRRLPDADPLDAPDAGLTITELCVRYFVHAEATFVVRATGKPSTHVGNVKLALRTLRRQYGPLLANDFPLACLVAIQDELVIDGLARNTVKGRINIIRAMFKWAANRDLVEPAVAGGLSVFQHLDDRTDTPKWTKKQPVPDADFDAVLPHLSPVVRAMVQLQRESGMRSGEVCWLTPGQVDTRGAVWVYSPTHHKMIHKGKPRHIRLSPRAQNILRPWMDRAAEANCFSAAESAAWHRQRRTLRRKTDRRHGNRAGVGLKKNPRHAPRLFFDWASYAASVRAACDKAGVTRWSPNHLRHTFASSFEAAAGLKLTSEQLGHSETRTTTSFYVEDSQRRADELDAVLAKIA
ncbi:MAG: site-specific integrase [Planctomycetota bacterium]